MSNHVQIGIIEAKCPKCRHNESKQMMLGNHTEYDLCLNCGTHTYCKIIKNLQHNINVECPYCKSTSVKKISTTSKIAYGATLGILAGSKLVHQWHCNNCKSDF